MHPVQRQLLDIDRNNGYYFKSSKSSPGLNYGINWDLNYLSTNLKNWCCVSSLRKKVLFPEVNFPINPSNLC